jgi:hypothetical protein
VNNRGGCGDGGIPETFVKITVVDHLQTTDETQYDTLYGTNGRTDDGMNMYDSYTMYSFNDIDFVKPTNQKEFGLTRCNSALSALQATNQGKIKDVRKRFGNIQYKGESDLHHDTNDVTDTFYGAYTSDAKNFLDASLRETKNFHCLVYGKEACDNGWIEDMFPNACKWQAGIVTGDITASFQYGRCMRGSSLDAYLDLQTYRTSPHTLMNQTLFFNARQRVSPSYYSTVGCFDDTDGTVPHYDFKSEVHITPSKVKCANVSDTSCLNRDATYSCSSGRKIAHSISAK